MRVEPNKSLRTSWSRTQESLTGLALVMPALLLIAAFTIYPGIMTLVHGWMSTPTGIKASRFVGLAQYKALSQDPVFRQVLGNNILYALGSVPASVAIALGMALLTHARLPGRALSRLAFFTPTMLPLVAIANIWLFIFTPGYGLLDAALHIIHVPEHNWLGEPQTVLLALVLVAIWAQSGFFMIFYLAALQNIPNHLLEAAAVEGANGWQRFWRVTWPLLGPTTLFVVVNATINAFSRVDMVFSLTQGGPDNASSLILYYIYQTSFQYWDTNYAAAMTSVLAALLAGVAALQFALAGRRTHYQ